MPYVIVVNFVKYSSICIWCIWSNNVIYLKITIRVNQRYDCHNKFTPPLEISKFLAKKLIVMGKISAYYINM